MLKLALAPLVCGVLVATLATGAWLAVGSPVPARAAVWMQVVKAGDARDPGGPDQPFFVLALGTGARSDNPNESPDDPGLADAIHVIGVNPALGAGTIIDIPRDTEGPGGSKLNSLLRTTSSSRSTRSARKSAGSSTASLMRGVLAGSWAGCHFVVRRNDDGELPPATRASWAAGPELGSTAR